MNYLSLIFLCCSATAELRTQAALQTDFRMVSTGRQLLNIGIGTAKDDAEMIAQSWIQSR